jgi:hypothetical protein
VRVVVTESFPLIFRVRQHFEASRIDHVAEAVEAELRTLQLGATIRPGQTVAITAGSRGIANIAVIVKAIVDHVRQLGATPFIVPAMGSHGGATVAGQLAILEGYGITEPAIGCAIRATMETEVLCTTREGIAVHFDRHAAGADHVFVCGRVKPHTSFTGEIESGLVKMMLVGLGKRDGARLYHRAVQDHSFAHVIRTVAHEVLARGHIVGGLAIVENAYDETAIVAAVPPEQLETRDKELLVEAIRRMPKLPFGEVDVVVVDEIGKDISGVGMDTNVLGRKIRPAERTRESPLVRRIVVRGLTEHTRGNATGLGLADLCTTRAVEQIDATSTYVNCLTSGFPDGAKIPIHFRTDREVITAALGMIGLRVRDQARLVWIRNTLDLAEVECSAAYLHQARARDDLEVLVEPRPLPFDAEGNLPLVATLGDRVPSRA